MNFYLNMEIKIMSPITKVDVSVRDNLDLLGVFDHHKDEYLRYVEIAKQNGVIVIYDNSVAHHYEYSIYPDSKITKQIDYSLWSFDQLSEVVEFCDGNNFLIKKWIDKYNQKC